MPYILIQHTLILTAGCARNHVNTFMTVEMDCWPEWTVEATLHETIRIFLGIYLALDHLVYFQLNDGPETNGCHFIITSPNCACTWFDGKYLVLGK